MAGANWVIRKSVLRWIALAVLAYALLAKPYLWDPSAQSGELWSDRLSECFFIWSIVCFMVGWLAVEWGYPPTPNSRIWPIVSVAIVLGIWPTVYEGWQLFGPQPTPTPFFQRVVFGRDLMYLIGRPIYCVMLIYLAKYWRKRGLKNACPECDYDMKINVSGRCPECGTQFDQETTHDTHASNEKYPELLLFETAEQRRKSWVNVTKQTTRYRWVSFLLGIPIACGIMIALEHFHSLNVEISSWGGAGIVVAWVWGFDWLHTRVQRRLLRAELIKIGIPVCLKCGADLREAPGGACPKCGPAAEGT